MGFQSRGVGFLAALMIALGPALAEDRRKVIIDQDAIEGPGLQPILMLLNEPSVEVLGITTVTGDGWQPEETAITLRMLELVARTDVPVIAGATFPLINSKARNARREAVYGAVPYKGAWMDEWPDYNTMDRREPHGPFEIPELEEGTPTTEALAMSAAEFMIEQTRKHPGEITIIAMGPLTNLALAQRLDPSFASRVKELVTEGGNFITGALGGAEDEFGMQIAYAPRMSFNHYFDPEAAHIVYTTEWPKLSLVTNDASETVLGDKELLEAIAKSDTPVARYVTMVAQPGFPLWDEIQAAAWLDPTIVTSKGSVAIGIDLQEGPHYGALLTWPAGGGPGLGEQDVEVVYTVDGARMDALFVDLLSR
ncbi:MAG: nucleoside hydrolase [Pseudomonadota bacterium]